MPNNPQLLSTDNNIRRLPQDIFWKVLMALTCACSNPARLSSHLASFGCSGPKAFSPIAIALMYNDSASSYLAWKMNGKYAECYQGQ